MELLQEEIYDHTSDSAQESFRNQQYQRSSMQRSVIVDRLRREGCRITKQRMINLLEEIGALKRKSAYRLCDEQAGVPICCVQLDDQTNIRLDNEKLCKIIEKGMESCGYLQSRRVSKVLVESGNKPISAEKNTKKRKPSDFG